MSFEFSNGGHIFLTGGTGFVGKCLLTEIAALNRHAGDPCRVTVLSRDPARFQREYPQLGHFAWLEFQRGDILTFDFPRGDFTHILHAAADSSSAAAADPVGRMVQIICGTRRALEFARVSGVRRFLLTSSGAVYGRQPDHLQHLPESYSGAPDTDQVANTYGQAKRAAEQLCTAYFDQYGVQATVARCFAFVGEYLPLDWHFAIGNFIRDALYRDAIRVSGDGTPVRSYLYGQDLAWWLLSILDRGTPAFPYNVGSDRGISIAELARLVGSVIAPDKPVLIEKSTPDNLQRARYVPDLTRASRELGLTVNTDLCSAVRLTVDLRCKRLGLAVGNGC